MAELTLFASLLKELTDVQTKAAQVKTLSADSITKITASGEALTTLAAGVKAIAASNTVLVTALTELEKENKDLLTLVTKSEGYMKNFSAVLEKLVKDGDIKMSPGAIAVLKKLDSTIP